MVEVSKEVFWAAIHGDKVDIISSLEGMFRNPEGVTNNFTRRDGRTLVGRITGSHGRQDDNERYWLVTAPR